VQLEKMIEEQGMEIEDQKREATRTGEGDI
jgi:hypothetical protein